MEKENQQMTQVQYDLWAAMWKEEHPGRNPPSFEQTNELMEMFDFSLEDIMPSW
jgi:hypothetical protein